MNKIHKNSFKAARIIPAIILIVIAFLGGYLLRSITKSSSAVVERQTTAAESTEQQQWWTCSMHPQIRQPKPGKCPICFMDLIPVEGNGNQSGPREISFSQDALKLMEIQTTPVERKFVETEIRMVGKVDYDETRVKNITAWVPGRIDRLYIDFTGITVSKGDHMVDLYSPELISAQAELLQALKSASDIKAETSELVKNTITATLDAAREKLRLLGLTDEQISKIESSDKEVTHVTIYSPMGGIVVHKNAKEGMYVDTGTPIYIIADLSLLWVKLDAYESDLPWIRYGQKVEFTTEAYPGETFKGRISFIDPVLDPKTRTIKLRVNVDNPEHKLKPEMFVRAVVRSKIAESGKTMSPDMAGKWICPMHPAVIKTQPGKCDICGMDLVTTESLGYVIDIPKEAPLVIPASAPLITGKRAVVYVRIPGTEKPTFQGREIVLGPRAGDYYIVKSGLGEGEIVVTNGNFKIDSALQIQAKPSMMNPEAKPDKAMDEPNNVDRQQRETFEVSGEFRNQIWQLFKGYLSLHEALAGDNMENAAKAVEQSIESLRNVDMYLLTGKAHETWMTTSMYIGKALDELQIAKDIEASRKAFSDLSSALITLAKQFGIPENQKLYRIHCPMAFDNKGDDWLQNDNEVLNPYFGAAMPTCGEVTEVINGKTE
jgi:Cu(I)/Ag(I) efflux system membrane fusion protein